MPALTLHLLSLVPTTNANDFVQKLRKTTRTKVVVASRPRRVVISPSILDTTPLLSEPWDLLLLLQGQNPRDPPFPPDLTLQIRQEYKINVGIPSKLLNTYSDRDAQLQRDAAGVPLTGSLDKALNTAQKDSSQNLEVSPELLEFMNELTKVHDKPVTMLNLLHFHHPGGKENYFKYGQAFVPVASKRGGNAKLVGNVIQPAGQDLDSRNGVDKSNSAETWWNEISIVHYPSMRHFCDMLAGEDYQEVNRKYRLGALRDTLLLCTTELHLEGEAPKL